MQEIDALKTKSLLENNQAILIDVRTQDKFLNEHIKTAINIPSDLVSNELIHSLDKNKKIILTCTSGNRATNTYKTFKALQNNNTYVLKNGLNGWKKSSLSTISATKIKTIAIERQIFIAAGSIVLLANIFGALFAKQWFLVSTFVGFGLFFAGLTGFCPMLKILQKMPWNK